MPAETFGSYWLVQRIGIGACGEVFRAVSRRDGGEVALKRMMPSAGADRAAAARLEREARLAGALDHSAISRKIDAGEVNGVPFLAYEYVCGRDLRAIQERALREGELVPLDVAVFIVRQIAMALQHAHTRATDPSALPGVIHRDVNPANILVSFSGEVKLSDFGAAITAEEAAACLSGAPSATNAPEIAGTPGYMSPEQLANGPLDGRTDIYALGACLDELLTGHRRGRSSDRPTGSVRPAREPPLSDALRGILSKALANSAEERYPTAERLQGELFAFALAEGHTASPARVAHYLRFLFPEAAAEGAASREEFLNMADSKGGSDLDVFDGLAKKPRTPAGLTPPASAPPRQKTLLGGIAGAIAPLALPPPATLKGPLPPPSAVPSRGAVAPPPAAAAAGESAPAIAISALPPPSTAMAPAEPAPSAPAALTATLVGPATPSASSPVPHVLVPLPPPAAVPPPPAAPSIATALGLGAPAARATPARVKAAVDMDWDDEEESTHVYDKIQHGVPAMGQLPAPGVASSAKVGAAGALFASSGGAAAPAKSVRPGALPPPVAPPSPHALPATGATGALPDPAPVPNIVSAPPGPLPPMAAPARPSYRADETVLRAPLPAAPGANSGRAGAILGGLALVVVLVLAVFTFLPKSGQLNIHIKAKSGAPIGKAEIYVDGQKKCDYVPCVVTQLTPGPRVIKLAGTEFTEPEPITEVVEAGKEKLVFITVEAVGGTGLKLSAVQSGVRLVLDGTDRGMLPLELRDLSPGSHQARFEAGDLYDKLEQSVQVVAGQVTNVGPVKLRVLKGQVKVDLATKGAVVTLVSTGSKKVQKRLPDGPWPIRLDLDAADSWRLVAVKKGFKDFGHDITFDDGRADKSVTITLAEEGAEQPAAEVPATPVVASVPGPLPASKPLDKPASKPSAEPASKPAPVAAAGTGTLNINSIPVSKVVLDGRPLGSTPKVGQSVSPGSHTVTFIHPEFEKKTVSVVVKAGETKTAAVRFK